MWMKRSICGIGVVSMAMRMELLGRGIELSSEREKLGKGYWIFMIFFARICNWFVVINFAYTGFMICQKIFLLSKYMHFFYRFFLLSICWISWVSLYIFWGRGAKYINLRARIKILFVNIYTSNFFFQRLGGWGAGGVAPLCPWVVSSLLYSVITMALGKLK